MAKSKTVNRFATLWPPSCKIHMTSSSYKSSSGDEIPERDVTYRLI